jgi:phosphoribosylanthranilate isomerase
VNTVGVFVNEAAGRINDIVRQCGLHAVQLHGDESPDFCERIDRTVIKAIRVKDASWQRDVASYRVQAVLFDTYASDRYGGTGRTFDWDLIAAIPQRIILSGGLNPDNVQDAIRRVHPYGVDTSSGVEATPGVKDHGKIRAFIEAAKQADLEFGI